MAQYIDKDDLVAEIEKRIDYYSKVHTYSDYQFGLKEGRILGYKDALHKINSLK